MGLRTKNKEPRTKTPFAFAKGFCRCVLTLCSLFFALCSSAQDIHFSQFNFSPLNQNPANTNLFDGDYRFVANYRNQWPSVPVRYNTFSISGEMNFLTLKNNDRLGAGLVFFFDRAGDSRFTSLNTALSISYIKSLDKNFHHALSGGLQFGIVNRNINYSKLNFDNQWNGDVFDPNIAIDENMAKTRFNYFDLGVGLAYRYTKTERTNFTFGFSAVHLTQPKQTFFGDNSVKLNPRFTVHTRVQAKVAKRWDVLPELMFQMQDSKYEVGYGAHAKYYVAVKSPNTVAVNMGVYGRSAEAGWLMAGVDYNNLQVNLSYDINFSKLRPASRYNGGVEVSVIYIDRKSVV